MACNCKKNKTINWCEANKDNCEPQVCCETQEQIDAKEVIYKLKEDCFSNLEELGIPKGSNLEYILEQFGQYIYDWKYLNIPTIPNQPQIVTFELLINYLLNKINLLESSNQNLQSQINTTNQNLLNLTNTVSSILNPNVIDTNGIGFTINSSIHTVIQKLSDNAL